MIDRKPLNFIFFGIAGSGKGTQVELLEKYILNKGLASNIVFASPGTEYRKIVSTDSYTSKKIGEVMSKGILLPDFLTISIITNSIALNIQEDSIIIADGYPRTIEQSIALEKTLEFYNRNGGQIIYIEVSREEALKRMKLRSRADDTDESIAKRFDEYVNNVLPAMDYFKDKNMYNIHRINGEQSIEKVHQDIINLMKI